MREWIAEHGEGPSVREIGARVGLSSTSSVAYQLGRLEELGLISRTGRPAACTPENGGQGQVSGPGAARTGARAVAHLRQAVTQTVTQPSWPGSRWSRFSWTGLAARHR
ncbi:MULTISPECIES: MarR family transcriptional regulator [unclassified Streptomyces]|uniref:LexA family protein n=1 Tax=unclassified Streptomyces TaxID=2593676 RepID=UPI002E2B7CB0|nr:MarR family transcriptional regulator [Streptomyces sp. NBC_01423]WSX95540.1 hypothetical protein OH827_33540 [Streptomyces sp. NBC_00891]WSY10020.1 hypothetical protein OG464_33545 [Streptomyces sp. NBC_00890]WSZ11643.1 hypothetical protein OG704_33545 [Streptomyces sp. NBC_00869]WSZ27748.1 hypothetical protein OG498_33545 [Streptomyces sp. NBC_00870]